MAEPSDGDRARAAGIVERLFAADSGSLETADDLVIFDVERDIARLRTELDLLDGVGLPAAGLLLPEEKELVLVSLSVLIGEPAGRGLIEDVLHPWLFDQFSFRYVVERAMSTSPFESLSTEEARRSLARRTRDFLATRIAAAADGAGLTALLHMRHGRGRAPRPTPGCNFVVTTDNPGLRVHWSGAYALSANYFGHPTTPVQGVLQAGRYLFAVDGGAYGNVPQWDTSIVVLPGSPHVHLNY